MSTDTPRTDAMIQTMFTDAGTINGVPADFARQLEREETALLQRLEELVDVIDKEAWTSRTFDGGYPLDAGECSARFEIRDQLRTIIDESASHGVCNGG